MAGRGGSGRGAYLRLLQDSSDESSRDIESKIIQSTLDSGLGTRSSGRGRIFLDDESQVGQNTLDSGVELCRSMGRGRIVSDDVDVSIAHSGSSGNAQDVSAIESSFELKPTSGRGKILQLLKEEEQVKVPVKVPLETTVESVTEELEKIEIEDEMEPVIRRGTKG